MQTTGIVSPTFVSSLSIIKAAEQQPKLAGELIIKTLEGLQKQNAQTPALPVVVSSPTGKGTIIDITV